MSISVFQIIHIATSRLSVTGRNPWTKSSGTESSCEYSVRHSIISIEISIFGWLLLELLLWNILRGLNCKICHKRSLEIVVLFLLLRLSHQRQIHTGAKMHRRRKVLSKHLILHSFDLMYMSHLSTHEDIDTLGICVPSAKSFISSGWAFFLQMLMRFRL